MLALNHLLDRMAKSLQNERNFNNNAAHELRTPLAAIQAHLFAARSAQNDTDRTQSIKQAQLGVERGIRLVGQMLALARLDQSQPLPNTTSVNLHLIAETVCAELAPLAFARQQNIELACATTLRQLQGNVDMLSVLLCNLVDNVIRFLNVFSVWLTKTNPELAWDWPFVKALHICIRPKSHFLAD